MQWSQLKKRVEALFAESVRGRAELGATAYRRFRNEYGRGWIRIDKTEVINMCSYIFGIERCTRLNRAYDNYDEAEAELHKNGVYSHWDWHHSLRNYLNMSIDEILKSENDIILGIGMLDSRIGKRRLRKMQIDSTRQVPYRLYLLRCSAEGIPLPDHGLQPTDLSTPIKVKRTCNEPDNELSKKADKKLSLSRTTRKIPALLKGIKEGSITEQQLDNDIARCIFKAFTETKDQEVLSTSLRYVDEKTKLLKNRSLAKGVVEILRSPDKWVRKLEEWTVNTHNESRTLFLTGPGELQH